MKIELTYREEKEFGDSKSRSPEGGYRAFRWSGGREEHILHDCERNGFEKI